MIYSELPNINTLGQEGAPDQRLHSAHHEAAHAVVGYYFGWWLNEEGVEIDERQYCGLRCWEEVHTERATVCVSLAGWSAEMRLAPDHAHAPLDEDLILYIDDLRCSPAFEDCDDVDALERLMQERPNASDEELIATYRSYEAETAALLARESIWGSVVRVANALLEKGKLQDEQAVGLLSSGVKGGVFLDEARHIA